MKGTELANVSCISTIIIDTSDLPVHGATSEDEDFQPEQVRPLAMKSQLPSSH